MAEPPVAGHGHRVRLDPAQKGGEAPAGLWRCIDHAPAAGHWGIQPADSEARQWLAAPGCPLPVVQGCVEYPSRVMRPPDVAALF